MDLDDHVPSVGQVQAGHEADTGRIEDPRDRAAEGLVAEGLDQGGDGRGVLGTEQVELETAVPCLDRLPGERLQRLHGREGYACPPLDPVLIVKYT